MNFTKKMFFVIVLLNCFSFSLKSQETWSNFDSGGEFTVAVKSDGTLWGWGAAGSGQLGIGNISYVDSPTQIGTSNDWSKIATGGFHTLAIKTDGTLWAWGYNGRGAVGVSGSEVYFEPVQVGTADDWSSVSAGEYHSCAIKTDGSLWCWGDNDFGQTGLGASLDEDVLEPMQIDGGATAGATWVQVSCGGRHNLALSDQFVLYAWGSNSNGQLGFGAAGGNTVSPTPLLNHTNWTLVSAGYEFSLGKKIDNTLWSWGANSRGQLGLDNGGVDQAAPQEVGADWKVMDAGSIYAFGIKTNNTLFAWGNNLSGELGVGDFFQKNIPTQVGEDTDWFLVKAANGITSVNEILGAHSVGLRQSKKVFCTGGANYTGQLGWGDITLAQSELGCYVANLDPNAVEDFSKENLQIKIFPNPSDGNISIDFQEMEVGDFLEIQIFSTNGNILPVCRTGKLEKTIAPKENLNLSHLESGIYWIKFISNHQTFVKKIIIL